MHRQRPLTSSDRDLTFRFALVVDRHKYRPQDEKALRRFNLSPDFLDLWRTHLRVPIHLAATFD
jgi:hypothetical protein